jgi:RHS repeat-associated protein
VARLYEGQASGWVSERAVYDGAAVIEEYQFSAGATNILRRYFYDGDVNRPCVVQANINNNSTIEDSADEVYRLISDERGSVLGIVDKAGNIVEKLHYNTTGLCKSYQADDATATLDDNGYVSYRAQRVRFGYCGMYIEPFTGKGHTLYRDYDALHNMWLSRDPIAEQGGINLTGYCNGNAVDGVDPYGLEIKDYESGDPSILGILPSPPSSVPFGVKYKYGTTWWENAWSQTANIGHIVNNAFYGVLYQLHPESPLQRAIHSSPSSEAAVFVAPLAPAIAALSKGAPLVSWSLPAGEAMDVGFITWMRAVLPKWMLRFGAGLGAGLGAGGLQESGKVYTETQFGPREVPLHNLNMTIGTTPNAAMRQDAQQPGSFIDPLTNQRIPMSPDRLSPDHLKTVDAIMKMKGIDALSRQQIEYILNHPVVTRGMPLTYNQSRGAKTLSEWTHYKGQPLSPDYIKNNAVLQKEVDRILEQVVNELISQNAGASD